MKAIKTEVAMGKRDEIIACLTKVAGGEPQNCVFFDGMTLFAELHANGWGEIDGIQVWSYDHETKTQRTLFGRNITIDSCAQVLDYAQRIIVEIAE